MAKETKNPACFQQYKVWTFDEPIDFRLWDYTPSLSRVLLRHMREGELNIDLVGVGLSALSVDKMGFNVNRIENRYEKDQSTLVLFEHGRVMATIICAFWNFYENDLWVLRSSLRNDKFPIGEMVLIDELVSRQSRSSKGR